MRTTAFFLSVLCLFVVSRVLQRATPQTEGILHWIMLGAASALYGGAYLYIEYGRLVPQP